MPRRPRVQYAGAIYHVFDRGDRREPIFLTDADRDCFLDTLAEACDRTGWRGHSYVLMHNHYHLLLETPEPNLVAGMKWFQGTYTQRFNRRNGLVGHLYQGRYKSKPIQPDQPEYFRNVAEYIHLNPARADLLGHDNPDLGSYKWSSFPYFVGSRRDLEKWLTPLRVFQSMGLEDNAAGRRAFRAFLEAKAAEIVMSAESKSPVREWEELSRSWYAGTESFRDWLVDRIDAVVHPHKRASYAGAEMQLHDEKVAESLLVKGLKALAVELEQVQAMRKIDPRKQGLAWLIKSHTVVGDQWVGQRLRMGDRSNISRAVNCFRNPKDSERQRVKALLHKCTD